MPSAIGSGAIGSTAITGNPPVGQRGKFLQLPRFRIRILNPVTGAVVITNLPHVVVEYENIFPQIGMAGSSTIGHFTVHLFHPLTMEYQWYKAIYDLLDQMQRVEFYMMEDPEGAGAAGNPEFTGIITNLPKEDLAFRIEGEDSLKLLDLSRTLPVDTFTGLSSDLVKYALKTYQMTKGEDWTGDLSAYTNDGTWALKTDQGFSSVKNGSTGDGLLFTTASYTNAQYADCFVEAPYRVICPTSSFAEAGVVAAVTDINTLIMGRGLLRWVAAGQYVIDAEIWQKSGGVYTLRAQRLAMASETTPNAVITTTLQGVQIGAFTYLWRMIVNDIDSGCVWTQTVASGSPTGGIGLRATFTAGNSIVQHHMVFMSKANTFQVGNIAVGQLQVNQPIASQQNIDLLSLASATEGWTWRKVPKPGLNNDQIDFSMSPGGDLSGIVRLEEGIHIVASQSERNAEPLNTAVLAAGHPAYNHGGTHRWYDISAISKRGLAVGSAVLPQTSDMFSLRQMAQNVLLRRKQPTQAKRLTVLRSSEHATLPNQPTSTGLAYRDGDWISQHEPHKGINYSREQIMSVKVTGGVPTVELTLGQYPVVTDRMPLVDRMNRVVESAQMGRGDLSIKDPATGVSHDLRTVLPYNPWKMRVYQNANQTGIASGAATKINYDTVSWDTSNSFSVTNHNFTVPVYGYYHCFAELTALTGALNVSTSYWSQLFIYVNSVEVSDGPQIYNTTGNPAGNDSLGLVIVDTLLLNVNDVVDIRVYFASAGNVDTTAGVKLTYWTMHLISG